MLTETQSETETRDGKKWSPDADQQQQQQLLSVTVCSTVAFLSRRGVPNQKKKIK